MTETRIIKFGEQDWKVTPFHWVVGPIFDVQATRAFEIGSANPIYEHWYLLQQVWNDAARSRLIGPATWAGMLSPPHLQDFVEPRQWRDWVTLWRKPTENRPEGCWTISYTNNPLIVNELQPEEVTLACIDDGKLVLTNFADLPGIDVALKVYHLGEFWLSYAEGGAEHALRFGRPRQ